MNEVPRIANWNSCSDRQSLETAQRFLQTQEIVGTVDLLPNIHEPQFARVSLDPSDLGGGSHHLRIHWYTNGDFSIQYERDQSEKAIYRWIRDPQSHEVRYQYSQSGSPSTETISLQSHHPIDVLARVLATIQNQ